MITITNGNYCFRVSFVYFLATFSFCLPGLSCVVRSVLLCHVVHEACQWFSTTDLLMFFVSLLLLLVCVGFMATIRT